MTRLLSGIFSYIDGHHTSRRELPSLEEAGYLSFYSLVSDEIPLKCYTPDFFFPKFVLLSTFLTLGFTSFYFSQVYDEMNRQVIDAILNMVF
jgi:hypothetical protein